MNANLHDFLLLQKSDRCKRVSLGVFLSLFVIAVVFGTVSAFVTNQYTYSGWNNLAQKVEDDAIIHMTNIIIVLLLIIITNDDHGLG